MRDISKAIVRLRLELVRTGDQRSLENFEALFMQFEEAEDRYRIFGGPSGREDLFTVLRRMNALSMAATGHTLTEWSSAPGTADGPVAVGSDPDVGQSRDAVVLCESDQAPREFATGFIIGSADGHLITCLHFFGGRASCLVHVGGLQFVADLKFDNANLDMAVARIRGGGYLPGGALKRPSAASARLRSGEMLHCFGRRPQGYLAERVAHVANPSVMLRLHHIGVPVAELDSTMQPGFSGAPALSGADEFRGVVVARVSELAGVRESDVAVLLPADHLTHWIKSLEKEHGYVIWTG